MKRYGQGGGLDELLNIFFAREKESQSTHCAEDWVGPKASLEVEKWRKDSNFYRESTSGYLPHQHIDCTIEDGQQGKEERDKGKVQRMNSVTV
jgi:hypothetical protein